MELLLISYQVPPQVVDRGMLTRHGGYQGNTTDIQKKEQFIIEYKDKDKQVKRSDEQQQKRRWVEHFKEMYNKVNVNNGTEESINMNTGEQLKINIAAPTKN
jgi:hypothetical protein